MPSGDVWALGRVILDLLADPERRRWMGEAGRRRVETTLAWERQKRRLLAAYSVVMGIQQ